ncbi:MAG TPA: hypothetical protein VJ044_03540 [Candidatus Hodarchaeales archaeon]|nr:hypothetical protein [Candidatus Hodarchaeales archaeon]
MALSDASYNKLVEQYGGKCVLLRDGEVVFADSSTKIVLEYAKKHFKDRKWKLMKVDSGEAALYGTEVSHQEHQSKEGL